MPVTPGLKRVLVLGAGPIVIGQACEFDYSGTQGCRALRSLGLEVVLVNSNPATIMTDPEIADRTYIEPLLPEIVERVIERERPDALLPTLGGQTALNLTLALAARGTLDRHGVRLIGASLRAIEVAEDRRCFREAMLAAGLELPRSGPAGSVAEALALGERLGYPLLVRSSFTLGGAGSSLVTDRRALREAARLGLAAGAGAPILVEECLTGWKEFELEVMRDRADNCVVVCSIENLDPMGVHTGDSITVAPAQTLSDRCLQRMRDAALAVMRAIQIEAGGSNVQFAVHPGTGEMRLIEMNPRVSRSSALASKATGFPIAKISALLAAGLTLDEIPNDITRSTPACFEPSLDYCVVKIPRWAFEKFPAAERRLGTSMKSVGEVMAIGRTFPEALLKAWRALEGGGAPLLPDPEPEPENQDSAPGPGRETSPEGALGSPSMARLARLAKPRLSQSLASPGQGAPPGRPLGPALPGSSPSSGERLASAAQAPSSGQSTHSPLSAPSSSSAPPPDAGLVALLESLAVPRPDRLRELFRALAAGATPDEVAAASGIDAWFLHQMDRVVRLDAALVAAAARAAEAPWREGLVREAKRLGIPDAHLAHRLGLDEMQVRRRRRVEGIVPVMKAVDTCGAEFPAETPYFYSTYEEEDEVPLSGRPPVVILGSGPNRIGQGLEFDSCCVHAALELRERGFDVLMVNSNPETVSTDYDVSTRLYFEPLTLEDVLNVVEREHPVGVIVQLGGQTPLALARGLEQAGVPIWGTPWDGLDAAENRARFRTLIEGLGLRQPESLAAESAAEALEAAERLGWPVLVRPSYVLGGRGMRVVRRRADLEAWLAAEVRVSAEQPVLLDRYLDGALEVDVDAVADGETVYVGAIMEHIEEAGVHSGDSTCVIPPWTLGEETLAEIRAATGALARGLGVRGLLNVQFAVRGDDLFVLEANPRASRTVPFASKAVGVPLARLAARVMAGERLADLLPVPPAAPRLVSVKKPVLPFARFPGEDAVLGPEMKSTGEVMGRDLDFGRALAKAHLGSGEPLPLTGNVFLSVRDADKRAITFMAKKLVEMGYGLLATGGTARFLARNGVPCREVRKVHEGRAPAPEGAGGSAVDLIRNREVCLVLNTPLGRASEHDDKAIRVCALAHGVPVITTVAGAMAAVSGMEALRRGPLEVSPLQEGT